MQAPGPAAPLPAPFVDFWGMAALVFRVLASFSFLPCFLLLLRCFATQPGQPKPAKSAQPAQPAYSLGVGPNHTNTNLREQGATP